MIDEISFDLARSIPLKFRIKRQADKTFIFTENGVDLDITGFTWELFIKRYPGDRKKKISLTLNNGLSIPMYGSNELVARFTSAQTDIEEGKYYWELVRTDIEKTYLNGLVYFSYGPTDSDADIVGEVIYINISDGSVAVEISNAITILKNGDSVGVSRALNFIEGDNVTLSITQTANQINVTINSSGSGGVTLDHWRGAHAIADVYPAAGTGSGAAGAITAGDRYYLTVSSTLNGDIWNVDTELIARIDAPGTTDANWLIKA